MHGHSEDLISVEVKNGGTQDRQTEIGNYAAPSRNVEADKREHPTVETNELPQDPGYCLHRVKLEKTCFRRREPNLRRGRD